MDFAHELHGGEWFCVFVDDTGVPGSSGFKYLPHDRRSWVAVIAAPGRLLDLFDSYQRILAPWLARTNAKELHFSDVFGGRRHFKEIPESERFTLIEEMVRLFSSHALEVVIQSIRPSEIDPMREALGLPERLPGFKFDKPVDLALFLLLVRVLAHLSERCKERERALVFVDEGWKRRNTAVTFPWPVFDHFADRTIYFGASHEFPLIQLADFVGAALTRSQLLLGKAHFNEWDRRLLTCIQPFVATFSGVRSLERTLIINADTGTAMEIDGYRPQNGVEQLRLADAIEKITAARAKLE